MDKKPTYIFTCTECSFQFKCGIINIDRHTIYCPKCNFEIAVDPEIRLYDGGVGRWLT